MSENHTDCSRFESFLLKQAPEDDKHAWQAHLTDCEDCRKQWATHQILEAVLAEEEVPELPLDFESGLHRKLEATIEVRPLRGWRVAAMVGYSLAALVLLTWVIGRLPSTAISIDFASPWTMGVALLAVPLSLWLTIGVTRWLPTLGKHGCTRLGLL